MPERPPQDSRFQPRTDRPIAPAPAPADVGVVSALSIEVGDLVDRLQKVRRYQAAGLTVIEGEHAGKIVAVIVGGVGRKAARRAADVLIAGHRPRSVISAGFAGALNPDFVRNQVVLPDEVVAPDGQRFRVGSPAAETSRAVESRLITLDRLVPTSAEKRAIRESSEADLVDMETSAVAEVCANWHVKFLSLRVISDDARTTLPPEIATMLAQSGSYQVGAAMRALWHRPSSLKDLWRLHEHALESAEKLAIGTLRLVEKTSG
jgi:adenosylhomocysteine nucleosidase